MTNEEIIRLYEENRRVTFVVNQSIDTIYRGEVRLMYQPNPSDRYVDVYFVDQYYPGTSEEIQQVVGLHELELLNPYDDGLENWI